MQIIVSREILLFAAMIPFVTTTAVLTVLDLFKIEKLKSKRRTKQIEFRKEEN